MKKKNSKRENVNLFFSAFLILAYIICGYFFMQFANTQKDEVVKTLIIAAILVFFGLLVFYATRVGEGKPIKRFSVITLILMVLPALYIVLASVFSAMPLHDQLTKSPIVFYMAAVALGYGVPYTFLSGFETAKEEAEEETEEYEVLEGGVEADLEQEDEAEEEEETVDEVVVEGVAADEEPAEDSEDEEKAEEDSDEEAE